MIRVFIQRRIFLSFQSGMLFAILYGSSAMCIECLVYVSPCWSLFTD